MTLIAALSLLLIFAHLFGRIAERFGQPALAGQMLAGIVLGPSMLQWVQSSAALQAIADISVLFVVITAGLEMRFTHVLDAFRGWGSLALMLGFVVPAAATAAFTFALDMNFIPALVATLCVSVTALPVALRILSEFGLMQTRVARVAISSALMTDILIFLVLGIAIAVAQPRVDNSLFITASVAVAKLGALLVVVGICHFVCQRLASRESSKESPAPRKFADNVLVLTLIFMIALGAAAELLGFHFVIGVFLAALMVTRDLISDTRFEKLEQTCELMTVSVFGPLFLAFQGIQFQLGALHNWTLLGGLIAIAVASKLVGGYATGRLLKLSSHESKGVGIIMNARGVMEMVVASVAYRAGIVDQELFSALLVLGIVTTILTPILLKPWMKSPDLPATMRAGGA
ncbi:MAG TPA: cation:proton antiporter [Steroidobacteraceae bacterium]|nr:cation:proton antiporter [Steroidobacteraceae bacterium]